MYNLTDEVCESLNQTSPLPKVDWFVGDYLEVDKLRGRQLW